MCSSLGPSPCPYSPNYRESEFSKVRWRASWCSRRRFSLPARVVGISQEASEHGRGRTRAAYAASSCT